MNAITIRDLAEADYERVVRLAALQGLSIEAYAKKLLEAQATLDPTKVLEAVKRMDELRAMTPPQSSSVPILREVRDVK